jgi:hypothetical protein
LTFQAALDFVNSMNCSWRPDGVEDGAASNRLGRDREVVAAEPMNEEEVKPQC